MTNVTRIATMALLAAGCAKNPDGVESAGGKAKKNPVYGAVCAGGPTAFGDVVIPIAEDIQSQEIWYSQTGDHQDCSGIFHRVLEAYQQKCPSEPLATYDVDRTSRQLGAWYLHKGLLTVVSDPVAQSNLILPGSVLFFGPNGPNYASMDPEKAMEEIRHVGVVVGVEYSEDGQLDSYSMFHGRRTGTYASITNDQRATGKPPFGNGPDAIIGVAPIATPLAPATAIPRPKGKSGGGAAKVEPGSLVCGGKTVRASAMVPPIVHTLEADKVRVSRDDEADRVRLFTLVAEKVAEKCPQLALPPANARTDYATLAQWFFTGGQFHLVDDPAKRAGWLLPGAVVFFGPANIDYTGMDPEDVVTHIDQIGVVAGVNRVNGQVTGYTVFQAPAADGGLATTVAANPLGAPLPLGLEGRAWLGVAPMFTRTNQLKGGSTP